MKFELITATELKEVCARSSTGTGKDLFEPNQLVHSRPHRLQGPPLLALRDSVGHSDEVGVVKKCLDACD